MSECECKASLDLSSSASRTPSAHLSTDTQLKLPHFPLLLPPPYLLHPTLSLHEKSLQPSQIMAACSRSSIGRKPMLRQVVLLSCHLSDVLGMGSTLTTQEGPHGDHDSLDDLANKGGVATSSLDAEADGL